MKKPDHRHRLLRPRRERPRRRRAAEERDELAAPHHSITSSARASNSNLVWRFDRQIGCLRFPAF